MEYSPTVFLVCHNRKDYDDETKIWKCSFEPSLDNPDETTNQLATCGGKTVCIIDVNTQQVVKRFQDSDRDENFYTLAWTTIEIAKKKKVNILAVGGELGSIKLIQPNQLLMYAVIRGHKKYISCLQFHPTLTTFLFSGARDGQVFLWDIGIPSSVPNNTHVPLLKISLQESVGDALNLEFSQKCGLLIVGAEKGCVGWFVSDFTNLSSGRRAKTMEKPDVSFVHPGTKESTIDGLIKLPGDLIATKEVGSGEILIWDLGKHVEKKVEECPIEPIMRLKYPKHDVKYLNLGFSNGLLGVGDARGNLLLYNIKDIIEEYLEKCSAGQNWGILEPTVVLDWPAFTNKPPKALARQEVVVNTVAICSNLEYVTGGTDNNLVCIWEKDEEEEEVVKSPNLDKDSGLPDD